MRQSCWRVPLRWNAFAILTTPILLLLILGILSFTSPVFVPSIIGSDDVVSVLASVVLLGLITGFFEELGWTGFVLIGLRRRYSILVTGLILGAVWGIWHGLADYGGASAQFGELWIPRIIFWILALTAYRVLIVWMYENTNSLLMAQIMHASFTGSQRLLVPPVSPADHFIWYGLFTIALWTIVLILALSLRRHDKTLPAPTAAR